MFSSFYNAETNYLINMSKKYNTCFKINLYLILQIVDTYILIAGVKKQSVFRLRCLFLFLAKSFANIVF